MFRIVSRRVSHCPIDVLQFITNFMDRVQPHVKFALETHPVNSFLYSQETIFGTIPELDESRL